MKNLSKAEQRKILADSMAKFKAAGNEVTVCPPQKTPKLALSVRE